MKTTMLACLLLVLLAACGAPAVTPQTPPEIVYGEDVCEHCGMIISDARFAAGVVIQTEPDSYEQRIFDDIGDMFAYVQAMPETGGTVVTYYVHDYHSQSWLDARQAHFVQADASLTPMGSGLAAFASREDAAAQAQAWHGTVLTFDAAQQQTVAQHHHAEH
jgi:copper chaperone NosL